MGRLTEELEAVRQYGRVTANTFVASSSSATSFTDSNNAAANNIAIITPESEAERLRRNKHDKDSRRTALHALRNIKYCGEEGPLQYRSLYRNVVNEQRVRREEAERNIREWRQGNRSTDLMLGWCCANNDGEEPTGGEKVTTSYWEEGSSMEDGVRPYDSSELLSYEAMKQLLVGVDSHDTTIHHVVEPNLDRTNAKDAQPKGPFDDVIDALCMQIEQLTIDEEVELLTLQQPTTKQHQQQLQQCYSKNGDLIFWRSSKYYYSIKENGTTTTT
jgi:hypothetical protein